MTLKDFQQNFHSKRKKDQEDFVLWINKTYVVMLVMIIWLTLYHIWTLNINATKWYSIRQLEIEKTNLLIEKELLDVKIAELESLPSIMKNSDMKDMEKIENPDYIVIKEWVKYVYND